MIDHQRGVLGKPKGQPPWIEIDNRRITYVIKQTNQNDCFFSFQMETEFTSRKKPMPH